MIGHFLGIPSPADAEEESPVGHAIEAGDHLGQIHGVVFGYETNRRAHFQLLSGGCRGGESNKRIKELLVVLRQFAAHWKWGLAAGRNMRMLAEPERLKSVSFRLFPKFGRCNRVMRRYSDDPEVCHRSPSCSPVARDEVPGG